MDVESVLEQVRSGNAPSEWNIWPLRRDYVRMSAIKWGLAGLFGFAMLIPIIFLTIPSDFVGTGAFVRLFSGALLTMLAIAAFGGSGVAIFDGWRLRHAHDYWLVITPETFVKAEPKRVTQTPLEHVTDVTLKGVPPQSDRDPIYQPPPSPFNGSMFGLRGSATNPSVSRQRVRGNASLTYRDSRDNKVVVICTDDSFDHMTAIYDVLRNRAARRRDQIRHASYQAPGPQGRGNG